MSQNYSSSKATSHQLHPFKCLLVFLSKAISTSWRHGVFDFDVTDSFVKNQSILENRSVNFLPFILGGSDSYLISINDPQFEKAFPDIEKYLKKAFNIANVSQDVLEAVTWGKFAGTSLWKILLFAITVDELLDPASRSLEKIDHEKILALPEFPWLATRY
jgi:hypothetical protein